MFHINELVQLSLKLQNIIKTYYKRSDEGDERPGILVDIIGSICLLNKYAVQYNLAKEKGEKSIYKADEAQRFFGIHASKLFSQLEEAINKPQIFHEHKCNDELRSILNQMYELAKQVKDTPLSSVEDSKDISTPGKEKTGSISSDGSTTVDADTPDSQKFPKNESASTRPPSPKVF